MRVMNTVSSVVSLTDRSDDDEAVALGDVHDARQHGTGAAHAEHDGAAADGGVGGVGELGAQQRAERFEVAVGDDAHRGVHADRALQLGRRVEGDDATLVDDRHPVAEEVGLLHVVRGEQDRLAVDVEVAEDLPQGDPALRVESGGRLVEEQHLRPVHDRPGDHQPLRHAAGERHHRRARALGETELLEQPGGLGLGRRARPCRRSGRGSTGSPTP